MTCLVFPSSRGERSQASREMDKNTCYDSVHKVSPLRTYHRCVSVNAFEGTVFSGPIGGTVTELCFLCYLVTCSLFGISHLFLFLDCLRLATACNCFFLFSVK